MRMNRWWPLLLVAAGACLFATGFFYDVIFAGIPYQDPTPEMAANYARHSGIASIFYWTGCGSFLVGCIAVFVRFVGRRFSSTRSGPANDAGMKG
jgi:hypothetical protein